MGHHGPLMKTVVRQERNRHFFETRLAPGPFLFGSCGSSHPQIMHYSRSIYCDGAITLPTALIPSEVARIVLHSSPTSTSQSIPRNQDQS